MKTFKVISLFIAVIFLLSGCMVHKGNSTVVNGSGTSTTVEDNKETNSNTEKETKNETATTVKTENRIVSTSVSICEMLDMLEIDGVVGVPETNAFSIPERYKDAVAVGSPMGPNMEEVKKLDPTIILSPLNLQWSLKKGYETANVDCHWVDLNSIDGLQKSLVEVGKIFGKEAEAQKIVDGHKAFMDDYQKQVADKFQGKEKPKVLVVMCVPIAGPTVATNKSYVGSLITIAGGVNVCPEGGDENGFAMLNAEEILTLDPDIIIRTCHADPDNSWKVLNEEFKKDTWTHFRAVKEGHVYDLPHTCGGMSANFRYQEGIETIGGFYDDFIKGTTVNEEPVSENSVKNNNNIIIGVVVAIAVVAIACGAGFVIYRKKKNNE